jgi:hypothetical protein
MARLVLCALCGTNLGVFFERESDLGGTLDYLPHADCWHVSREQVVEDLDALHAGESSLPVSLKRIPGRARPVAVASSQHLRMPLKRNVL